MIILVMLLHDSDTGLWLSSGLMGHLARYCRRNDKFTQQQKGAFAIETSLK